MMVICRSVRGDTTCTMSLAICAPQTPHAAVHPAHAGGQHDDDGQAQHPFAAHVVQQREPAVLRLGADHVQAAGGQRHQRQQRVEAAGHDHGLHRALLHRAHAAGGVDALVAGRPAQRADNARQDQAGHVPDAVLAALPRQAQQLGRQRRQIRVGRLAAEPEQAQAQQRAAAIGHDALDQVGDNQAAHAHLHRPDLSHADQGHARDQAGAHAPGAETGEMEQHGHGLDAQDQPGKQADDAD